MRQITTIDSNSSQSIYFASETKNLIHFTFHFSSRQQAWFLDVETDTFNVYGIQICCLPNLLDKYRNIIDFGVSIVTEDGLDPWRVTDFEDGYCSFYVLNPEELKEVTELLDGNKV